MKKCVLSRFVILLALLLMVLVCGCANRRGQRSFNKVRLTSEGILDAASRGDIDKARRILEQKPNLVNAQDPTGLTPLHMAANPLSRNFIWAFGRYPETVSFLISSGADVNAKDESGYRPLHHAAGFGGWDTRKVTMKTASGQPVRPGEVITEIIGQLIDGGADVNAGVEGEGNLSALHLAAFQGLKESVVLLIEKGADINARATTTKGKVLTPLDVARRAESSDYLKKCGAKRGDEY